LCTLEVGDDSLGIIISGTNGGSFDDEANQLSVASSLDGDFGRANVVEARLKIDFADWIKVLQHFNGKIDLINNMFFLCCIL